MMIMMSLIVAMAVPAARLLTAMSVAASASL